MKKILYLDDEKDDLVLPIKRKLESTGKLEIKWDKPDFYESEVGNLLDSLSHYDGLLLDLQLNGPQEDGKQVKYQAPTIAQTIRTYATEGKIKDIPIILCSTEARIKETYDKDFTSHNLFDWTFLKKDINDETIEKIICMCNGYSLIVDKKGDFEEILKRKVSEIDERVFSRFMSKKSTPPSHEIARVIFKDLVQPIGLLVDENILAARLGIDIAKSADTKKVFETFNDQKYRGVFSECWPRWWSDLIVETFEKITGKSLAVLNAKERVDAIKQSLRLNNIVSASPEELNSSTDFWTICQVSKNPLDPFEGYRINMREEPKPWQEYSYASLISFVGRKAQKEGIEVHPLDEERLKQDSESLSK
ncbi:hypothetical protein [Cyclobacterium sp.]|uniref:hypothetical protein n=1 Tax=Cyclobacterium sp. TaxID=1966343 RepID=UPI0019BF6855|nr:hypothetical protein [Cyclobacterium sp.]MBD3628289.1 hypothetical protein [Cyclobacterium sp.]